MTLQDDIARWMNEGAYPSKFWDRIAAGLERDYYLVKLADLPEVTETGVGNLRVGGATYPHTSASDLRTITHRHLAMFIYKANAESEAAA